jgi:hypothetical protein
MKYSLAVCFDQDGNFRVGEYFRIDQATGRATLNASAFDLAGLTSLRLGSIGAQLGETINEFSADITMSGNSNMAVPTEYAVRSYVLGQNGSAWSTKTSAYTASKSERLFADTTSSAFTVTLPASPSVGDFVQIADAGGKFSTNKLTVGRNGSNIMALAEDMDLNVNNVSVTFVYQGSTQGWRIS